jgi:hypothetical protein
VDTARFKQAKVAPEVKERIARRLEGGLVTYDYVINTLGYPHQRVYEYVKAYKAEVAFRSGGRPALPAARLAQAKAEITVHGLTAAAGASPEGLTKEEEAAVFNNMAKQAYEQRTGKSGAGLKPLDRRTIIKYKKQIGIVDEKLEVRLVYVLVIDAFAHVVLAVADQNRCARSSRS